ncbi:macB [Symbiodinium microadriaticum]|nr:macB [Symbiodinium microadriaticum]
MVMMIRHETSFDTFHQKSDRIFQVIQVYQQSDGEDPEIWTPNPLAEALKSNIASVENAIAMHGAASNWVEVNGKRFFEEDGILADDGFLEMFDFELVSGDREVALKSPRSTIISQSLVQKYFDSEDPIGQVIRHEFYGSFTVTGVMKDVPSNSYLQFDYILTRDLDEYFTHVASWFPAWFESWEGHPVSTFVQLKEGSNPEVLGAQIENVVGQHLPEEQVSDFYLLNLLHLHFGSNGIDGRINQHIKGDIKQVQLFSLVAIAILAMACFNYINITTARSIKRNKEIGIRKTIGAHRSQLTFQFLVESFILISLAALLALGCSYLLLPFFKSITGINLVLTASTLLEMLPWILATILAVTLLAGFYPAIVLSRNPEILGVTGVTRMFSGYRSPTSLFGSTEEQPEMEVPVKFYGLEKDALATFDMELVSGQDFSGNRGMDSTSIILNETAARELNVQVGQTWVNLKQDQANHTGDLRARVIGIVKDFHFESLHEPIKPVVMGYLRNPFVSLDDIVVKIDGQHVQEALAKIENIHNQYDTNDVMTWEFLDDMIQRSYEKEVMFRRVFTGASVISLVIALLGMIGLISYHVISRTKEFGIRKVLGASMTQIYYLQGRAFFKFIAIASLISMPLAFWLSNSWLDNYAFRVVLTPFPFGIVLAGLLLCTLLTVWMLGRHQAKENPAKSLRYE